MTGATRSRCREWRRNPRISIAVPRHRVIGRNGTLTGYAGGVQLTAKVPYRHFYVKRQQINYVFSNR